MDQAHVSSHPNACVARVRLSGMEARRRAGVFGLVSAAWQAVRFGAAVLAFVLDVGWQMAWGARTAGPSRGLALSFRSRASRGLARRQGIRAYRAVGFGVLEPELRNPSDLDPSGAEASAQLLRWRWVAALESRRPLPTGSERWMMDQRPAENLEMGSDQVREVLR